MKLSTIFCGFSFLSISECTIWHISTSVSSMKDKYQDQKGLAIHYGTTLTECSLVCVNNERCISYFHNNDGTCMLHSDPFVYTTAKAVAGWRFFTVNEASQRCPRDYYYYRHLDLCYNFNPPIVTYESLIKGACGGNSEQMLRIDSEEKMIYFRKISEEIGRVYPVKICIQGTNTIDPMNRWTYFDGTLMNYTSWYTDDEPAKRGFIRVERSLDFKWKVVRPGNGGLRPNCTYMCEYTQNVGP